VDRYICTYTCVFPPFPVSIKSSTEIAVTAGCRVTELSR